MMSVAVESVRTSIFWPASKYCDEKSICAHRAQLIVITSATMSTVAALERGDALRVRDDLVLDLVRVAEDLPSPPGGPGRCRSPRACRRAGCGSRTAACRPRRRRPAGPGCGSCPCSRRAGSHSVPVGANDEVALLHETAGLVVGDVVATLARGGERCGRARVRARARGQCERHRGGYHDQPDPRGGGSSVLPEPGHDAAPHEARGDDAGNQEQHGCHAGESGAPSSNRPPHAMPARAKRHTRPNRTWRKPS